LVAGAAAGAVAAGALAASWLGKRRSKGSEADHEALRRDLAADTTVEQHRSFDYGALDDGPRDDGALVDGAAEADELSRDPESLELPIGRSADPEIDGRLTHTDASLDEIWNALPGFAEGEQTEGYDAVTPEDLGAVWLERATQTTHDHLPHASDPMDTPSPEGLTISEASMASSLDEEEADFDDAAEDEDEDDDDDAEEEDEAEDDEDDDDEAEGDRDTLDLDNEEK
jgi:hypothetical protein